MRTKAKIVYWVATGWLALGMLSSGIMQALQIKAETDFMTNLGYPAYFAVLLGVWKILGF
nr:DoxX family protein [Hymenobacter cellulosilyticus]